MRNNALMLCRVCGLEQAHPPWGEDGLSPTYDYCPCCGTEFGYQDSSLAGVVKQRERWLAADARWAEPDVMPAEWDLGAQIRAIPLEWRGPTDSHCKSLPD